MFNSKETRNIRINMTLNLVAFVGFEDNSCANHLTDKACESQVPREYLAVCCTSYVMAGLVCDARYISIPTIEVYSQSS
jgi:hypothetical protein